MTITTVRVEPLQISPNQWHASRVQEVVTVLLITLPVVALTVGVWLAWHHGLSWLDIILAVTFYLVAGHGITVGYHRYLTHGSFAAKRPLRLVLAIAGSLAVEGGPLSWVAGHRRHHRFTDEPGDPHSPHAYGQGVVATIHGFVHAHVGWLFSEAPTDKAVYVPDLLTDRALVRIDRLFPLVAITGIVAPFGIAWALTGRVSAAVSALIWAGLVRVGVLHHMTWSINSVCHLVGSRPFRTRPTDKATNVWPLAIISMGESWHNLHHSDPTSARHGVDRWQLDSSARLIRWLEQLHWVSDVRWPTSLRLERRRVTAV